MKHNKDKVLFKAKYDLDKFNKDAVKVSLHHDVKNYSIMNVPFTVYSSGEENSVNFLSETYNLTTYTKDLKKQLGYVSFFNNYVNDGEITSPSVIKYKVFCKEGIYRHVDYVVIDFSETVRRMYFVKKCKS